MKRNKFRYLYLFAIFVSICNLNYAQTVNNHFDTPKKVEKGDLVYRGLSMGSWVNYHTGVYLYYVGENSFDDRDHSVGEQLPPVGVNTLWSFKEAGKYIGERRYFNKVEKRFLTLSERIAIENTIINNPIVSNVPYVSAPFLDKIIEWNDNNPKDGEWQMDSEDIIGLRCDGFVELVYALNGIKIQGDIINNTNLYNL